MAKRVAGKGQVKAMKRMYNNNGVISNGRRAVENAIIFYSYKYQ